MIGEVKERKMKMPLLFRPVDFPTSSPEQTMRLSKNDWMCVHVT